ncbi:hypothetical protein [uncultured Bradyrhizobium sp.]|uniref:hypothetical protein n=1 Tax=uncultured Bradyrhizobium sp. TaxID=199684 RepID=UPI0035CBA23A
MTTALLAVAGGPVTAQTAGTGSAAATSSQQSREAPNGHRQPRAGDLPSERNPSDPNDPLGRENAALEKKIKSICRGC